MSDVVDQLRSATALPVQESDSFTGSTPLSHLCSKHQIHEVGIKIHFKTSFYQIIDGAVELVLIKSFVFSSGSPT